MCKQYVRLAPYMAKQLLGIYVYIYIRIYVYVSLGVILPGCS